MNETLYKICLECINEACICRNCLSLIETHGRQCAGCDITNISDEYEKTDCPGFEEKENVNN